MQTTLPMNERGILFRSARHHTHHELTRWDEIAPFIDDLVIEEVEKRARDPFKVEMISKTCLARYFFLINSAVHDLFDTFTETELALLLYCRAHPSWNAYAPLNFEDLLIELCQPEHEHEASDANEALRKLRDLTPRQQDALADLIECAWRQPEMSPLEYLTGRLNNVID